LIQRKTLPTQLHTGKQPLKERFEPPQNYGEEKRAGYMKPYGGMWTSTWGTAFDEGWPAWCLRESFHIGQFEEAWLLEPEECRVIELIGFDMCHEFLSRYGQELYRFPDDMGKLPPFFRSDGPHAKAHERWHTPSAVCPVWEKVAEEVDAVRLLTPYSPDVRLGPYLCFNAWDCESTIWLSWKFSGVTRVDLSPYIDEHKRREEVNA
jgi:hypothetical protein